MSIQDTPFKVGDTFLNKDTGVAKRITGTEIEEVVEWGHSRYFVKGVNIYMYGTSHEFTRPTEIMIGECTYSPINWKAPEGEKQ